MDDARALDDLEHLRSVRDAIERMSPEISTLADDLDAVELDLTDLEHRENYFRKSMQYKRERLVPVFRQLAVHYFDVLEADAGTPIEKGFIDALDALTQLYVRRAFDRAVRNNELVTELLTISEGLPANDTEQDALAYPAEATRFGPNRNGKYTGIKVRKREAHLSDIEKELSSMLIAAQEAIARAGTRMLSDLVDGEQMVSEVTLDPTPYFLPGE
ncbi:hypothetical protein [Brevibacterium sp. W7.2]|uniref:hypothetical protein n=1 Tax=Brevibacterium sp. W7.2 TaxID=2823518 RepID=UPI001BAAC8A9|nr:hypothetical protein [Brevibacterium sp. W7.2]